MLNTANKVLGWAKISSGGIDGTVCDMRVIFQIALNSNASKIILSHNHPSGNTTPSKADLELTLRLKKGGELLNIDVLDHIIMTAENHYSIADNGQM